MTDKDLFAGREYNRYVRRKTENIISGAFYTLRQEGFNASKREEQKILRHMETSVKFEPNDPDFTAYTAQDQAGNKSIALNAGSELIQLQQTREDRHLAILGMLYHEIGHVLFTDFPTFMAWINQLDAGVWFPEAPKRGNTVNGINLTAKMKDNAFRGILVQCAKNIENAIEDGFIEREMREMYPVRGTECLSVINASLLDSCPDLKKQAEDDKYPDFLAIVNQILLYSKFGEMLIGDYDGELMDPIYECVEILDEYCYERDPMQRARATNEILCVLFPYLDSYVEEMEKQQQQQQNQSGQQGQPNGQQNGQGSGSGNGMPQNGSGNGSSVMDSVAKAITDALNQAAESMGISDPAAKGNTSSAVNKPNTASNRGSAPSRQKAAQKDGNGKGGSGAGLGGTEDALDSAKHELDSLVDRTVKSEANKQAEKERTQELNQDAACITDGEYGRVGNVHIVRASEVDDSNVEAYNKAMEQLRPISKDLQRGIARVLKERREGGKRKNLPFGRRLEVSSVVHGDGKYFSRNKLPTESPKLGVALLVDESGSTSGKLINAATRASLVVEDFCRELQIPHIINGYTGIGDQVTIRSYAEPNTADRSDCYRITGMDSCGGTPTKGALIYMLRRLNQLPVDVRLLIVISDGMSADNYYADRYSERDPAKKPIRRMIANSKKDDTIIVAAGIGQDRKYVEEEFGEENFMDISDLDAMPEQLIKLIKDNIWV